MTKLSIAILLSSLLVSAAYSSDSTLNISGLFYHPVDNYGTPDIALFAKWWDTTSTSHDSAVLSTLPGNGRITVRGGFNWKGVSLTVSIQESSGEPLLTDNRTLALYFDAAISEFSTFGSPGDTIEAHAPLLTSSKVFRFSQESLDRSYCIVESYDELYWEWCSDTVHLEVNDCRYEGVNMAVHSATGHQSILDLFIPYEDLNISLSQVSEGSKIAFSFGIEGQFPEDDGFLFWPDHSAGSSVPNEAFNWGRLVFTNMAIVDFREYFPRWNASILSPKGCDDLVALSVIPVTWSYRQSHANTEVRSVDLYYSVDSTNIWELVEDSIPPSQDTVFWTVPDTSFAKVRLRLTWAGSKSEVFSTYYMSIVPPTGIGGKGYSPLTGHSADQLLVQRGKTLLFSGDVVDGSPVDIYTLQGRHLSRLFVRNGEIVLPTSLLRGSAYVAILEKADRKHFTFKHIK